MSVDTMKARHAIGALRSNPEIVKLSEMAQQDLTDIFDTFEWIEESRLESAREVARLEALLKTKDEEWARKLAEATA